MKDQFQQNATDQEIDYISFKIPSATDIAKSSVVQVKSHLIYQQNTKLAVVGGPMDAHLGPNLHEELCKTCNKDNEDCAGHFGHAELISPIVHPGFFKHCYKVLQCICKVCSRVLLDENNRDKFSKVLNRLRRSTLDVKNNHKEMQKHCMKTKVCTYCKAVNGKLMKFGTFGVSHEKYKIPYQKFEYPEIAEVMNSFDEVKKSNPKAEDMIPHLAQQLDARLIYELFKAIPDEDLKFLAMENGNRPENMILLNIPIAPNTIRQSAITTNGQGTSEDDLTVSYSETLVINEHLLQEMEKKKPLQIADFLSTMQNNYAMTINGELSVVENKGQQGSDKKRRGIIQRLKGKQGRFRGNLSGKRVNFTARTVISPDPNLRIDQVGIPIRIAMELTYPEIVNKHNINKLRKLVKNGPYHYPGCNYVRAVNTGEKRRPTGHFSEELAKRLRPGDIVDRHVLDDDVVLFNRQPSLHRVSIMAHYVKVGDHRTFRFNECVCNPYNADFDGDEMNVHLPQTEEAKAEAVVLMGTKNNIVTPRSGEPLIAAIQDFITGAYLITQKDVFFGRAEATRLAAQIVADKDRNTKIELPPPAILKPVRMWTGKQIFSLIMRPNRGCDVKVCLDTKGKTFKKNTVAPEFCSNDSHVLIQNSEILCGQLDKVTLGGGSKKNIFYILLIDYGQNAACMALWRLAKIVTFYLSNRGFSIGIEDVTPSSNLVDEKRNILARHFAVCDDNIKKLKNNTLACNTGCDAKTTLENILLKELSDIRNMAGDLCKKELRHTNGALTMALCGSKGSHSNMAQMAACVGQQAINGKRAPNGFDKRALPHFEKESKEPKARGFVSNSFYSGLTATEFFFHTMAGREGLVDTAVKTAETGYMQRRLVKSLEDLSIQYDNTVRNANDDVVQFLYGGDGLDPISMEDNSKPVNFDRVLNCATANNPSNGEASLSTDVIVNLANEHFETGKAYGMNKEFLIELRTFVYNHAESLALKQKSLSQVSRRSASCITKQIGCLTKTQLDAFYKTVESKYLRALIEPGTAVGALGAQSIGEPGTQMTLKTFHFAGVASFNITQGVPRIRELIDAAVNIDMPIIDAPLSREVDNAIKAKVVQGRIRKKVLSDVMLSLIDIVHNKIKALYIRLDQTLIDDLRIDVSTNTVMISMLMHKKLKQLLKLEDFQLLSPTVMIISPKDVPGRGNSSKILQILRETAPSIVVAGLEKIVRAVINEHGNDNDSGSKYNLIVEGVDLLNVMGTRGVIAKDTMSNNTMEVCIYVCTLQIRRDSFRT